MAEREFRKGADVALSVVDYMIGREGFELLSEVRDQQTFELVKTYRKDATMGIVVSYDPSCMDNVRIIGNDDLLEDIERKVKFLEVLDLK